MMTNNLWILQKDWYYIRPFWIRNPGPFDSKPGTWFELIGQIDHTQGLKYIRPFRIRNPGPFDSKPGTYLSERGEEQTRVNRYHRTMKNRIFLEHYYSTEELEKALGEFIDFCNTTRLLES